MTTLGSGGSWDDSDVAESVESSSSCLIPASRSAVGSKIVGVLDIDRERCGDVITVERRGGGGGLLV